MPAQLVAAIMSGKSVQRLGLLPPTWEIRPREMLDARLQAPDTEQSQEHGMAKGVGLAPARGDPVVINEPDNQIGPGFLRANRGRG